MSIKDYDRIIQLIEENITREKSDLSNMVATMLTLSERQVSDILKFFDPDSRTLKAYILERKIYRALEDFTNGMTKDSIAEKYNYNDMTHFGQSVMHLCEGKTPLQLRKEGYECPAPLYLKDIIGEEVFSVEKITEAYTKEMIGFIDEITRLKDELSREKRKKVESIMSTTASIKDREESITAEKYKEFLKIEDLRALYGFDVSTILKLYNDSLSSEVPLEDLCDLELEKKYYSEDDLENENNEIGNLAYRIIYEGDSVQNYEYYYGDDEVDDRESVREENLYSDYEVLMDFDDICDDGYDKRYEGFETEEDNEPTEEELEEWLGKADTNETFA